jgi:indolepyruvate ferredoxin oxidoreductase alpha subunit
MGVPWVAEVNPNELRETQRKIAEAVEYPGVAVVVSRAPCILLSRHQERETTYQINPELCTNCGVCTEHFGCPAIYRDGEVPRIDPDLCNSCGVCQQVCGHKAIEEVPIQ